MISENNSSNEFILLYLFIAGFLKHCAVCDLLKLVESVDICGLFGINSFFSVVCLPFVCSAYKNDKYSKKDIKTLPTQEDAICYESRGTVAVG